ncbi:heterokaryon incompatibility protein [Stagonosporopsis vannaccii]|nr:heterokaryon incompatibility protein [Stagonosporopsis vannaccii]
MLDLPEGMADLEQTPLQNVNHFFTYEPLQRHFRIRILWLHSGDWDSPIEADLSTLDLDALERHQAYEAISYAWGYSTGPRQRITCNGQALYITSSLFEALQVFRQPRGGEKRILWADGICINQHDTAERNHQVQLMRRIYTAASKVLIWLGHDDPVLIRAGFDLVCQIAGLQPPDYDQAEDEHGEAVKKSAVASRPQYIWRKDANSQPTTITSSQAVFDSHELKALCPLFDCTWFERLWTIQELALSRAAEVYWGLGQINFKLIGVAALHVLDHHQSTFLHYNAMNGLKRCCGMYNYWTSAWDEVTFFGLLVMTRRSKASEPRDKVFGILGLSAQDSDPEGSVFINPDYSLSVEEVYTAVARKILLVQKDIDLLAAVQHGCSLSETEFKHSWVPDWTKLSTNYLCNDRNTSRGSEPVVSLHKCEDCAFLSPESTVTVQGILIDTIKDIWTDEQFNWTRNPSERDFAHSLQTFIRATKDQYDEATLAYTLTGGYAADGYIIEHAEPHITSYRAFLEWDIDAYFTQGRSKQAPTSSEPEHIRAAYRYYANCKPTVQGRRPFTTRGGMLGLGPSALKETDVVVVLFGGSVPFILRRLKGQGHYRLVGECYVHDVMDGQAVDRWKKGEVQACDFHLV